MDRKTAINTVVMALQTLTPTDNRHVMKGQPDELEGKSPVSIVEGYGYQPLGGTRDAANLRPQISVTDLVRRTDGSGTPIDPGVVEDMLSDLTAATMGKLLAMGCTDIQSGPADSDELDGSIYRGERITAFVRFDRIRGG